MLKQYSTLTSCLAELRRSDLPIIEKLRLEVQLIQTKRILLDLQVELKVAGRASSEREFNGLYEQLKSVCRSGGDAAGIQRLKDSLQRIKEGLDLEAAEDEIAHTLQMAYLKKVGTRKPLHLI